MNAWGVFALIAIAVPTVAVLVWVLREQQSARTRRKFLARNPHFSVSGIQERVERERADEALRGEDTEVIDVPTEVIPVIPSRQRRYIKNPPSPYPREPKNPKALSPPEQRLMQSVIDGLKRLE
jgi:hypothetical protein